MVNLPYRLGCGRHTHRVTDDGQDLVARPRRLALMNLYLHQVEPHISLGDSIWIQGPGQQGLAAVIAAKAAGASCIISVMFAPKATGDRAGILRIESDAPGSPHEVALTGRGTAPAVLLEASGGVNLKTIRAIAEAGVDRVSVGALTHSAPSLDIALDYG